jgi:arabinan endo-1,5-alpha-L-arabinosidase
MRRLNPETDKPSSEDKTFYSLANRPEADENAIEAPYIIRRNDFCYLFVSFDHCCGGVDSDDSIRVGRSKSVTGPYVDKGGAEMTQGGGTLVLRTSPLKWTNGWPSVPRTADG